MPFQSEAQRRFMFAKHPRIAHRWADEAKAAGRPVVDPQTSRMIDTLKASKAKNRSAR